MKGKPRYIFHIRGTYKNFNLCDRCLEKISSLGYDNLRFNYHKDYSFYLTDLAGKVITFAFESDTDTSPEKPSSDSNNTPDESPQKAKKPFLVNGVPVFDLYLQTLSHFIFP